MPRWPVNLLLKLFGEPQVAIGGGAATAEAFLPAPSDAPVIQIRSLGSHARPTARRSTRRRATRRRLPS
jgi:hypothetical protein